MVDVFGCPLPADSIVDVCNLTATVENLNDLETIQFNVVRSSNISVCVTTYFTKAGCRKLILGRENECKELSIHVNLDVKNVHWELTAPKNTVYKRENLTLTANLLDCFSNELRTGELEIVPHLREIDDGDGDGDDHDEDDRGLQLQETSIENDKVTFKCHFDRTGHYNLCLADQEFEELQDTSIFLTVIDAPLDSRNCTINWKPKYNEFEDQPVFTEDESFQCVLKLRDIYGFDCDRTAQEDQIVIMYDDTEVRDTTISRVANEVGSYEIDVPLQNLKIGATPPKFWCSVNGETLQNPLTLPTFTTFEEYDEENCEVQKTEFGEFIVCNGVMKDEIVVDDSSRLDIIKKVCKLNGIHKDKVYYVDGAARIRLPREEIEFKRSPAEVERKIQECRNILLYLLRAVYYLEKAFAMNRARRIWKQRGMERYERHIPHLPTFCKRVKEKYAELMVKYHENACENFFQFFNKGRSQNTIDLHGLLVVNEEDLQEYREQLDENVAEGNLNMEEANEKIEKRREESNEAIRYSIISLVKNCRSSTARGESTFNL